MRHNNRTRYQFPVYALASLLWLVSTGAWAQTYYVNATTGNDSNNGTSEATAFQTIQKASNVMAENGGGTCNIAGGIYRETVTVAGNDQTFQPIDGDQEKVIITGTDVITGWTKHQGNIYKKKIDKEVTQLFFNRKRMEIARFPDNTSDDMLNPTVGTATNGYSSGSNYVIEDNTLDLGTEDWTDAQLWHMGTKNIDWGPYWVAANKIAIKSSTSNSITFPKTSSEYLAFPGSKYYIFGALKALSTGKEWFYEDNVNSENFQTLFFNAPSDTDPSIGIAEARVRFYGFDMMEGSSNIEITGINFYAANLIVAGSNSKVTNCKFFFPTPYITMLDGFKKPERDVRNDINGVTIAGNDNEIVDCIVAHSWNDGITLLNDRNTVSNCLLYDLNWSAMDGAGIFTNGDDHTIVRNTIHHVGRSGIVNRITTNTKVQFNDIHNYGKLTNDLGGTYTFESNGGGTEISYNWVHDAKNEAGDFLPEKFINSKDQSTDVKALEGVYLDNGSSNYFAHHNVVWNVDGGGFRTNADQTNNYIYNNSLYDVDEPIASEEFFVSNRENARRKFTNQWVFNNLTDNGNDNWVNEENNFQLDFSDNERKGNNLNNFTGVNPASDKFVPDAGSTPVDYGRKYAEGVVDYSFVEGSAPDAGAYEQGDTWTAGTDLKTTPFEDIFCTDCPTTPPPTDPTARITPEADAFVRDGSFRDTNYGTNGSLLVKNGNGTYHRRSLLRFNLADLEAGQATTLSLSVVSIGGESEPNRTVELYAVDDSWSETDVTWANQPSAGTRLATLDVTAADVGQTVTFDVTDYVNAERAGDGRASFVLRQPSGKSAIVNFGARESDTPAQLAISTPPPPTGDYTVTVRAQGKTGNPTEVIRLLIDEQVVATWPLTTAFADYTASVNALGTIKLDFPANGLPEEDAVIDYLEVSDGTTTTRYETEEQPTNTASYNFDENQCGGVSSAELYCPGYVLFDTPGGVSAPAASLSITALGAVGDEELQLLFDGEAVATWQIDATVESGLATYTTDQIPPSADTEIRISFNEQGVADRNVRIQDLTIVDGSTTTVYESEKQSTNTGVFINGVGCSTAPSQWMQCSGYILYETPNTSSISARRGTAGAVQLYPNPTDGRVTVSAPEGYRLQVIDVQGSVVWEEQQLSRFFEVETNDFVPGVYLVHLQNSTQKVVKRLIVSPR